MIRALFWDRAISQEMDHNKVERNFINELKSRDGHAMGHAIADGRVINDLPEEGSHHQKLLLVNGSKGLTAFAGGIDFDYGRVFHYAEPFSPTEGKESPITSPLAKTWSIVKSPVSQIDLHPEPTPMHDVSAPLHDVHTQIQGPAAYDLLGVFLSRYADHPSAKGTKILAPYRDYETQRGPVTIRVCTTFGDKPISDPSGVGVFALSEETQKQLKNTGKGSPPARVEIAGSILATPKELARKIQEHSKDVDSLLHHPYSFAPKGRQSGRAQLLYAISCARKYIYFEDQYMVSEEIAKALKTAIEKHHVQVIGVIPHQTISGDFDPAGDGALASVRRGRFIEPILGEPIQGKGPDPYETPIKFALFCPVRSVKYSHRYPDEKVVQESPYQYVHSKLFIFDDEFCTIGSMNNNLRSTTHDSELSLGFHQPGLAGENFARRLRMRLWEHHLNLPESQPGNRRAHREYNENPLDAIKHLWSGIKNALYQRIPLPGIEGRGDDLEDKYVLIPRVARYDWSSDKTLSERLKDLPGTDKLPRDSGGYMIDKMIDPVVHVKDESGDDVPVPIRKD
jgi:phosphatidylserine/phosphatidylglycerophosphate/cardiolipin synthase-like enzyme